MKTKPTTDEVLDAATIAQLTWKPGATANIARRIVEHFRRDHIAYTDDVDLSFVFADDCNVIGLTWRRLKEQGILKETGRFRRCDPKKRPDRRGGKAYQYRLASDRLAQTFLERNGWSVNASKCQAEMEFNPK